MSFAPIVSKKPIHSKPRLMRSISSSRSASTVSSSSSSSSLSLRSSRSYPTLPILRSSTLASTSSSTLCESCSLSTFCSPTVSLWLPHELMLDIANRLNVAALKELRLVNSMWRAAVDQILMRRFMHWLSFAPVFPSVCAYLRNEHEMMHARHVPLLQAFSTEHLPTLLAKAPYSPLVRVLCECLLWLVRPQMRFPVGRVPLSILRRDLRGPFPNTSQLSLLRPVIHLLSATPNFTFVQLRSIHTHAYFALVYLATVLEASHLHDEERQFELKLEEEYQKRTNWAKFVKSILKRQVDL